MMMVIGKKQQFNNEKTTRDLIIRIQQLITGEITHTNSMTRIKIWLNSNNINECISSFNYDTNTTIGLIITLKLLNVIILAIDSERKTTHSSHIDVVYYTSTRTRPAQHHQR